MIRSNALRELNFILHEAPGEDGDWGWFSREHAVITHAVLQMLGQHSTIIDGLLIMQDGAHTLATIPLGHAWNLIDGKRLLDTSITTHHMTSHFKEFTNVDHARAKDCPYAVHYADKIPHTIREANRADGLYYYRKEDFYFDAASLLEDPYAFIHKPANGIPDLLDSYGRDLCFKLAYHIYLIHQGQANPLPRDCEDALEAVAQIRKGARKKVLALLAAAASH